MGTEGMTCWHWGPMIGLDTETTGKDPETARLVQVGIVKISGPGQVERESILVNPGVEIPEEATDVHGITTEKAWAEGVAPTEALEVVGDAIADAGFLGWPVIIFNAPYDLTVLDREMRRQFGQDVGLTLPRLIVDPFVIDRALDKYRKGKRTLEAMCEHYRIPQLGDDHAHDASTDAFMACRLAWRLASTWESLADLAALQERQVVWYRERQEDFIRYLQREGKPIDDVSTLWPIRPKLEAVRG